MKPLLFDTCFLIDLGREMWRRPGPAHAFLERHALARACISWIVAGEFAEGFEDPDEPACREMLAQFHVLPVDWRTACYYASIARDLRQRGELIGANDLWIASGALAHGATLVTRNLGHFKRVPGLETLAH